MPDRDTEPVSLRLPILAAILDHAGEALGDIATLLRDSGRARVHETREDGEDAPSIARFTWAPVFASAVREEAVIRIDGRYLDDDPGMRALRVTERRDGERSMFGNTQRTVTLLLLDLDSGRPGSITAGEDMPLEVGVQVPSDLADLGG